jgi:hypothetical protein
MMCGKNCLHIGTFQLGSLQDLLWPHWINCRRISSFFINNPGSSIPKQESRKIQSLHLKDCNFFGKIEKP